MLSGKNHPQWKGGKPTCPTCGVILTNYTSKSCIKHRKMPTSFSEKMRGRIPWNKGIKMGKEFSDKCKIGQKERFKKESPWNKGLTAEINPIIRSGDKINTWKGGVTPVNEKIRKSNRYIEWRDAVYKRDNYTCVLCKKVGDDLNADHIKQFALYPELRFELSNGRTLCVPCHRKTPTFGRLSKKKLLENPLFQS